MYKMLKVLAVSLFILVPNASFNRIFDVCPKFPSTNEFYVVGHAGGDWNEHCENTKDTSRWALSGKRTINSIIIREIDNSIKTQMKTSVVTNFDINT